MAAGSVTGRVPGSVDRTYAEETVARAVAVLGDVRADADEREDAARVIQVLLVRAHPTEADLADIIQALSRALEVDLAIHRVLGELRRLRAPQVVGVARGVEQLMSTAFRERRSHALSELILVAFDEPAWDERIRDDWGRAALAGAIERLPESKYSVAFLIGGWLSARGDIPEWMREVFEGHPDLVTSGVMPQATRWHVHRALPTVAGWKSLAALRGAESGPALETRSFGSWLDVAVETLEQALGETTDEARKTVLGRWLHELTGVTR